MATEQDNVEKVALHPLCEGQERPANQTVIVNRNIIVQQPKSLQNLDVITVDDEAQSVQAENVITSSADANPQDDKPSDMPRPSSPLNECILNCLYCCILINECPPRWSVIVHQENEVEKVEKSTQTGEGETPKGSNQSGEEMKELASGEKKIMNKSNQACQCGRSYVGIENCAQQTDKDISQEHQANVPEESDRLVDCLNTWHQLFTCFF